VLSFIVKRLLQVIPLLLVIMTLTFFVMRLAPGNPFASERQLSAVIQQNLNRRFGLDRPIFYVSVQESWTQFDAEGNVEYVNRWIFRPKDPPETRSFALIRWNGFDNQYNAYFFGRYVTDDVTKVRTWEWGVAGGNFGPSTRFTDARNVTDIILAGLPISLSLGFLAYLIALGIGVPIGIVAAYKQNTSVDYASMASAVIGLSVPGLVLGPVLIVVFSLTFYLLPPALMEWIDLGPISVPNLRFLILPAVTLSAVYTAYIARLMRAAMLETLRTDYVRTARAKGLSERVVVFRHALRGAMLPVVSFTGPALAFLIGGTVVVERIFALAGLGQFFLQSANNRDYTLTLGIVFFVAIMLIVMNLIVDVAYAIIDPRIKYS
jgi:oligopeptide transport system permease protein